MSTKRPLNTNSSVVVSCVIIILRTQDDLFFLGGGDNIANYKEEEPVNMISRRLLCSALE